MGTLEAPHGVGCSVEASCAPLPALPFLAPLCRHLVLPSLHAPATLEQKPSTQAVGENVVALPSPPSVGSVLGSGTWKVWADRGKSRPFTAIYEAPAEVPALTLHSGGPLYDPPTRSVCECVYTYVFLCVYERVSAGD